MNWMERLGGKVPSSLMLGYIVGAASSCGSFWYCEELRIASRSVKVLIVPRS